MYTSHYGQAESDDDVTQFRGGKKICQKECVLIINTKTRVIPLLVNASCDHICTGSHTREGHQQCTAEGGKVGRPIL